MQVKDLIGSPPTSKPRPIVAKLITKVKDNSGHEHGNDGKFSATPGGGAAPEREKPKQKKLRRETDLPSHVTHGHISEKPHAIFLLGGGGSGKGAVRALYVGKTDKEGNETSPAMPGFSRDRVVDPDEEKKRIPIFTPEVDENGLYGPSGPKSPQDLYTKYPRHKVDELNAFINQTTGGKFRNVDEWRDSAIGDRWDPEKGEGPFGGGLTHEIGSYIAKQRLKHHLENPHEGSFVWDAVGGEGHVPAAEAAVKAGYRVTFHHVNTPVEVAQMRNAERDRKVAEDALHGTHKKLHSHLPRFRSQVAGWQNAGAPAHFHSTDNWTLDELGHALGAGWTPHGFRPALPAPAL